MAVVLIGDARHAAVECVSDRGGRSCTDVPGESRRFEPPEQLCVGGVL